MKEELMALQELFKETIAKYGIEYANATTYKDGTTWITIKNKDGKLIDIDFLEEGEMSE